MTETNDILGLSERDFVASGEEENARGSKGFAGLSTLVSEVDLVQPPRPRSEPDLPNQGGADSSRRADGETSLPGGRSYQPSTPETSGSSARKWLWIVGVVAVISVIGLVSKERTSPASSYVPSPYNTAQDSPVPIQALRPDESKPPVGQNLIFSMSQIRYCLAEDIRMDGAKAALNNYNGADVDRFNAMVGDYNSRCGHFRYRSGSLESAKSEVAQFADVLKKEGEARFSSNVDSSPSKKDASVGDETRMDLNSVSLNAEDAKQLVTILNSKTNTCSFNAKCSLGKFDLLPVDIDADGKSEYLVTVDGYCGSGGCSTFLYKEYPSTGWRQIAGAFGWVGISKNQHNGYLNLVVQNKVYRSTGGWDMSTQEYTWSGSVYQRR